MRAPPQGGRTLDVLTTSFPAKDTLLLAQKLASDYQSSHGIILNF